MNLNNSCILAVVYREATWTKTAECIAACKAPSYLVSREGVGSLAEAFNRGFRDSNLQRYPFVWFVSNVTFGPTMLEQLTSALRANPDMAAVHPAFDSDHRFLRQKPDKRGVVVSPFVEFTAPLVRSSVFAQTPLDEDMPYTGHDLDWGIRIRQLGYTVGVCHGCKLGHTYIRNTRIANLVTAHRKRLRDGAVSSTKAALARKYGNDWRKTCSYTI